MNLRLLALWLSGFLLLGRLLLLGRIAPDVLCCLFVLRATMYTRTTAHLRDKGRWRIVWACLLFLLSCLGRRDGGQFLVATGILGSRCRGLR